MPGRNKHNNEPAFSIRCWTSADRLDEIMAMVHAAFGGLAPPSGVLKETTDDLARRQRDGFVLVAMDGDRFIGSMFCAEKDGSLYLTRMATRPDLRGRGIGYALLRAAETEARALGLPKLLLRVRKTLPDNLAYFTRFGFVVVGEGQEEGRTPFDVMEKAL
jgi:ribosomal protein S18 acetylase RimI-like enzyme